MLSNIHIATTTNTQMLAFYQLTLSFSLSITVHEPSLSITHSLTLCFSFSITVPLSPSLFLCHFLSLPHSNSPCINTPLSLSFFSSLLQNVFTPNILMDLFKPVFSFLFFFSPSMFLCIRYICIPNEDNIDQIFFCIVKKRGKNLSFFSFIQAILPLKLSLGIMDLKNSKQLFFQSQNLMKKF